MKKVTAFESENGKLFHTKEECEKYEKRQNYIKTHYPKTKTTTSIVPYFDMDINEEVLSGLIMQTEVIKESPNSYPKKNTYFIIDKFKLKGYNSYVENAIKLGFY